MALATYAVGLALVAGRPGFAGASGQAVRLGRRAGPERAYLATLAALNRLSNAIHDIESATCGAGGGGAGPGRGAGRRRGRDDAVRVPT